LTLFIIVVVYIAFVGNGLADHNESGKGCNRRLSGITR
jgi:hypothetical protein